MTQQKYFARWGKLMLGVGIFGTVVGALLLASGGSGTALGGTALCLVLGAIQVTNPLLVFENDHFAYRAASLSSQRQVLYRDLRAVARDGNRLVLQLDPAAGPQCVILLNAFAPEQREVIEQEIKGRLSAAA